MKQQKMMGKEFYGIKIFQKENIIFSILFAAAVIFTQKIKFNGVNGGDWSVMAELHPLDVVYGIGIAIGTWCIVMALLVFLHDKKIIDWLTAKKNYSCRKIFFLSFFIIFIAWLLSFLTFFPGVGMNDSIYLLKFGFDLADQHPPLYCAFIEGCKALGNIWGNLNYGIAFYSVCQIIIMDLMVSYCIMWFAKKNVRRGFLIFLVAYFAGITLIANFSIAMIKDSLFGTIIMMWIPFLYDLVKSRGEVLRRPGFCIGFILLGLGTIMLRNNGKFVYPLLLLLLLVVIRHFWIRILIFGTCVMAIGMIPEQIVKMNEMEPMFQESVAIPLQQMARTLVTGGVVTEEQRDFLEKLLPFEKYQKSYRPFTVDAIKWNKSFDRKFLNEQKEVFLSTWAGMLKDNLRIYIKAYLFQTYGFWSVGTYDSVQSQFFSLLEDVKGDEVLREFVETNRIQNTALFPEKIQNLLENFYRKTNWYPGAGTCLWLTLLVGVVLISFKKYREILVLMPVLLVWGTIMISTPIAFAFRYTFMYAMSLPFFILIPFLRKTETERK